MVLGHFELGAEHSLPALLVPDLCALHSLCQSLLVFHMSAAQRCPCAGLQRQQLLPPHSNIVQPWLP